MSVVYGFAFPEILPITRAKSLILILAIWGGMPPEADLTKTAASTVIIQWLQLIQLNSCTFDGLPIQPTAFPEFYAAKDLP